MIEARHKVFRTFSLTATWVPLLSEVYGYLTDGVWSDSLVSSTTLSLVNGAAYLYFRRTQNSARAFRWSSLATLGVFAWSAFYDGGLHSDHFDYVYLYILANVFFYGRGAVLKSTAAVMVVTLALALAEYFGKLPVATHGLGDVTVHFLACQALAAWFIFHFESARRDATREATDQREHSRMTFDLAPTMHFTKDLEGRYQQVNRAFAQVMNVPAEQLIGKTSADFLDPVAAGYVRILEAEVLSMNRARTFDAKLQVNGQTRLFTSTLFPIPNADGTVRGLGGILVDNHEALVHAAENRALTKTLNETALVMTVDLEGRILSVNDNFCAVSGFGKSELIGRAKFDHAPAYDNHLFAVIGQAVKLKRSWTGEIHEVTRDGREYVLGTAITPILDDGSSSPRFLIVCFDITPQVLAETQYRSLIDTMEEGVIIWDEYGNVVQTNRAALRIMEMTHDELSDRTNLARLRTITDEDGNVLSPTEFPAARAARHGEGLFNSIVGVQSCDGRQRWMSINSKPTVFGGRRVIVCTLTDVTNQRQTLNELKVRAEELQSLFYAMTEGMYLIDIEGRISLVNRAATRILGYDHDEIMGAHAHNLFHHSHPDGRHYDVHECPLYDSLKSGKPQINTTDVFWRKDGTAVHVSTSAVPVENNGEVIGSLVTFRDLTDLKRLENQVKHEQAKSFQSAKLASLGEMSAGIAHEINNPMAIVTGSLEMLKRYREQPDKFELKMQAVIKAAARINKIVLGLQKFARANQGGAYTQESLAVIVADSVVMTETKARRHDVRVTAEVDGGLLIACDVVEIEQVLINLINNAVDAIKDLPDRWITIGAVIEATDLVLRVTDAGAGISTEIEEKLFQPFFTTKPVGQGTGLGLSIAKGILEQHGASLTVNRQTAHTCFEIRFTKWERTTRAA